MKRVKNLATLAQRFHKQCLRCHYMGEGLLTTNLLPLSAALQAGASRRTCIQGCEIRNSYHMTLVYVSWRWPGEVTWPKKF